ncbi:DNA polymerase iota-like [Teleopsis dalmanni]|uniref:DNA polymerase iota-like n=1 Tax=Teleopsis dalmanni TaxID=139649 RepID=UPI0018CD6B2B|nr:DNA polymerase iota-like [Teleopsis dalmanni]XP_037949440.1 DNA polymerase iota-like [Teleopsis dalmanni]XP_037949441.1 DNA polymerase iota-like [Teleopsis dalmanni]
MDFTSVLSKSEPHQRTIIHLDMDCFYAQVEEIRNPALATQPLGIQQKNIVVTSNYVARKFGVTKLMLIEEAKRICPQLVLVKGEDLSPYRQMSQRIFEVLLNYTPLVEKLGFDENFMDVSALVQTRQQQTQQLNSAEHSANSENVFESSNVIGNIYPSDGTTLNACDCGCAQRLAIGTQIAKEIRDDLRTQLGITCCAGISYNKLLAKLVGAQNKPNQQTVLVSSHMDQFMRELKGLHRITGVGQKTESLLLESGIANVEELQNCDMELLRKKFGAETAKKLRDLSFGRDTSLVKPTGKPKTIGLEDSCKPISVSSDVEERFRLLLMRLLEQVSDDGRIPIAIKVILRKFDPQKKTSHRETKQANILPSLFKTTACTDTGGAKVTLVDGAQDQLLQVVMRLFERVVDLKKPFNITLIGLAFSKFQQRKVGSSSIANFLIKKTDLEVQSITSLTNTCVVATSQSPTPSVSSTNSDEAFRSSPTTFQPSDQFYRRRATTASPIPMLVDNGSESAATNSDFSDFSETEIEPSPKKSRLSHLFLAKRRCLRGAIGSTDAADVASPSKLRVCDLRLNSRDSDKDFPISPISSGTNTSKAHIAMRFRTIPPSTLVSRLEQKDRCRPPIGTIKHFLTSTSVDNSPLHSPMDETSGTLPTITTIVKQTEIIAPSTTTTTPTSTSPASIAPTTSSSTIIKGNVSNIPYPAGVDSEVFNELPIDVQNELIASWRNSLAAAVANQNLTVSGCTSEGTTSNVIQPSSNTSTAKVGSTTNNGTQKNTLYRYFLRNK